MSTDDSPTPGPWYSKITPRQLLVAAIVAVVTALGAGFGNRIWSQVSGERHGSLKVISTEVAGEPATSPNYNAPVLDRIAAVTEFPRVVFTVRNEGAAATTLLRLSLEVRKVWTLSDPYGPVTPPERFPPAQVPPFGKYGPYDMRLSPGGFVVPDSIVLNKDIAAGTSTTVTLALRNVEEPSVREYVFWLRGRFDGEPTKSATVDLLVASQPIGSFYPEYLHPPRSFTPQTGQYNEAVADMNRAAAAEIARTEALTSPRVRYLLSVLAPLSTPTP